MMPNSKRQAFEALINEAIQQNRRIILLEGKLNPILGDRINTVVRDDMRIFFRNIVRSHPEVILIPEADLPAQSSADYDDLTHVNEAMQLRFTAWLGNYLISKVKGDFALLH